MSHIVLVIYYPKITILVIDRKTPLKGIYISFLSLQVCFKKMTILPFISKVKTRLNQSCITWFISWWEKWRVYFPHILLFLNKSVLRYCTLSPNKTFSTRKMILCHKTIRLGKVILIIIINKQHFLIYFFYSLYIFLEYFSIKCTPF